MSRQSSPAEQEVANRSRAALRGLAAGLIANGFAPVDVVNGMTLTFLEAVGVLVGNEEAARRTLAASMSYCSAILGDASPEVAAQRTKELIGELLGMIEASQ